MSCGVLWCLVQGDFIKASLDISDSGAAFGLLQSAFIAGYVCAAVVFGHLVHTHDVFRLMGYGTYTNYLFLRAYAYAKA
jgi:hypothetical protein